MFQKGIFVVAAVLLVGCGSGLCPLGSAYRTNCSIAGSSWSGAIGVLDTSFGGTGIVTTPIGASGDQAYTIALQPDGKILLGGQASFGSSNFALARYHSNGSLDTTFNGTGFLNTVIDAFSSGRSLALQSDGKIVLGGSSFNADSDFAIARYHSNGSLDTAFNTTGYTVTLVGAGNDFGQSVAIQSDGKILLGGYSRIGATDDFAIARYHSNGSLDTTFNATGIVTTAIGVGHDIGSSIAVQPDGKILLGGNAVIGGNTDFAVARYHANGSLDTTFNSTGFVTTAIGVSADDGYSLVIQSDGKILLGGATFIGATYYYAIARYHSNGSLDTTFNSTGSVTTALGTDDTGYGLALQPDGKILLGGTVFVGGNNDVGVARYHSNGSLDTTFNVSGFVTTTIVASSDFGRCLALQPDGKILLGGYAWNGANYDFALARYR
jgi:uncharacterized delta-60 repeat protein